MSSFPFSGDMDNSSILYMFEKWIATPELKVLVQSFGGNLHTDKTIVEQINQLIEFSNIWDFKNKESLSDIESGKLSKEQKEITLTAARKLGLSRCIMPSQKKYDYILVMGGTGISCLLRMKYVKELYDKYSISASYVVGLTGMREIMKSERTVTDTYAFNAKTEFDLMKAAVTNIFVSARLRNRKEYISENLNESWVKEFYKCYNSNIPIILFAAPSEEPKKRRANIEDAFSYFMKQLEVGCGVNLLLITNQISVPYQQLKAIELLGIPYNHSVETVGFPDKWSLGLQNTRKPENYLQEIHAILQAMGSVLHGHTISDI